MWMVILANMSAVARGQVLVAVGGVAGEDVDLVLVRVPPHAAMGLGGGHNSIEKEIAKFSIGKVT